MFALARLAVVQCWRHGAPGVVPSIHGFACKLPQVNEEILPTTRRSEVRNSRREGEEEAEEALTRGKPGSRRGAKGIL